MPSAPRQAQQRTLGRGTQEEGRTRMVGGMGMRFFKKQFRGLNAIEKIALVLSSFYGVGIVSLIQYNAYYTGGESLDFLRIKPILVGLQYFIYLGLPAILFAVPLLSYKCWKRIHWSFRMVMSIILCLVLMLTMSTMLHYFVPFIIHGASLSAENYYWVVAWQFWSMYFYWDFFHVVGICLVLYFAWVFVFKNHSLGWRCNSVMFVLCVAMNLFYFNKDMYVNIVQSAGGGAPRAGIITISNPPESMKKQNENYYVGEHEIIKPCFILEENNDHYIIAEMFDNYIDRHLMSEADMRASATWIARDHVRQFQALNYYLGFKNADSIKFQKYIDWDTIHHLDVVLNLRFAPLSVLGGEDWNIPSYGNVTNDIVFSWWDKDGAVVSAKVRRVNVGVSEATNLVQQIKFSGVRFPCGIYVHTLQNSLTHSKNCIRIDNLPATPNGYKFWDAQLIFVCNFVYDISFPGDGDIVEGNSLLVKTKGK